MRNVLVWLMALLRRLVRPFTVLLVYGLIVGMYLFTAWLAAIGGHEVLPPVVHEGLRVLIAVQIGRAFWQRWDDFSAWQRLLWLLVAVGMILTAARGQFSDTPLTVSYMLSSLGLLGITWRLMAASRREQRLERELAAIREECGQWQKEALANQEEKVRIGKQARTFEDLYNELKAHTETKKDGIQHE